jgi:dipeptidyl aminopeptidase/acylaminoacyl peptidase
LLIHPVDYEQEKRYPLVVTVHGGTESHYSNGWITSYSRPESPIEKQWIPNESIRE